MTEKTLSELSPFEQQWQRAEAQFTVTNSGGSGSAVYLNAEAGTGSRYGIVISKLPMVAAAREGGLHLITVLQPWQTNMVFTVDAGEIHPDYLMEKLLPKDRPRNQFHGGDVAALWLAVNKAREMFLQAYGMEEEARLASGRKLGFL